MARKKSARHRSFDSYYLLYLYLIPVILGLSYALSHFWPTPEEILFLQTPELRYLLLAALAGALGASIRMGSTFLRRKPLQIHLWMMFLSPVLGCCLGILVYLVVRGGLLDRASSLKPYGVVTLSSLAGMFGHQAFSKIKEVVETIIAPPNKERSDSDISPS